MTPEGDVVGMPQDLLLVRYGHSEGNRALEAAKRGDTSLIDDQYRQRSSADYRLTGEGHQRVPSPPTDLRPGVAAYPPPNAEEHRFLNA